MWEFHSFYDGLIHRWSWKYFLAGRLQCESSPKFRSMNEAIYDAKEYGFESDRHRWNVVTLAR